MATNPSTPPPASALLRDDLAERHQRALNGKASEAADPFSDLRLEALRRLELSNLEAHEPHCMCLMNGGDLFDPRDCELHNSNSWWNVRMRQMTDMQRYEEYEPKPGPTECPF